MKKSIKIWLAVTGILLLVLGVICICNPAETLFASAWMIGALTLASGIFGLAFTLETQAFIPNSGTRMLSSLLQLFLGMFLSGCARIIGLIVIQVSQKRPQSVPKPQFRPVTNCHRIRKFFTLP